ncbi:hypothetical protein ACHQM5_022786 [Ranunculus cassubicifolius]
MKLLATILFSILFLFTFSPSVNAYQPYPFPRPTSVPRYTQGRLPPRVIGPESFTYGCGGDGPYTGVADGRVFKRMPGGGWTEFGYTSPLRTRRPCDGSTSPLLEPRCGRPLGVNVDNATCDILVADAYHGLMKIPPTGGRAIPLVSSAEGVPFRFTNSLDVDHKNRVVYFTDSSTRFTRREHLRVSSSGDKTGRLMAYDLRTNQLTVLLRDIKYANGVALSKNKDYLLVSEIGERRILRYWLQGPKANTTDVFANFFAAPDNIKRTANGDFWVAMNNGRNPGRTFPEIIGFKLNSEGQDVQTLLGDGWIQSVSEIQEHNGMLLIGTINMPYVGFTPA